MIRVKVREQTFKKGEDWVKASRAESKVLIGHLDLEDDEQCPVEERDPGRFFFTEDFTLRLYDLESTDESVNDFVILEEFRDIRTSDPDELRYWFHDMPVGNHILVTRWSEPDSDGDRFLEFVESYADVDT